MPYFNGGWWLGMAIIMIIIWGGIIALIIWGIRRFSSQSPAAASRTPLDIARERYARGEITKEQFEQLKKDLS